MWYSGLLWYVVTEVLYRFCPQPCERVTNSVVVYHLHAIIRYFFSTVAVDTSRLQQLGLAYDLGSIDGCISKLDMRLSLGQFRWLVWNWYNCSRPPSGKVLYTCNVRSYFFGYQRHLTWYIILFLQVMLSLILFILKSSFASVLLTSQRILRKFSTMRFPGINHLISDTWNKV